MKLKHIIPLACLSFGLILNIPSVTMQAEASSSIVQSDGWTTDKKSYYQNSNKVTGVQQIENTYYYFNQNGLLVTGRHAKLSYNGHHYFVQNNGTLVRNGWATSSSNFRYYAGNDAKLYTNRAVRIGKHVYCFSNKAVLMTNGLKTIGGKTYLVSETGIARTGRRTHKGNMYIFDVDGVMQKGVIKHTNGKLYYADTKTGALKTGFFTVSGKTYYAKKSGVLRTGWQRHNGTRYYFNPSNGSLQTGWIKNTDGRYYYYTAKGNIKTGWITVRNKKRNTSKKYYAIKSGPNRGVRVTGIQWINGKRYYFSSKQGVLQTGWVKRSGHKYYMNNKGVLQTGWKRIKKQWYFFEHSGAMRTGWVVHNQKFYYLNPSNGAMVTGLRKIGSKNYRFNSNGTYQGGSLPGAWQININRAANVVTVYKGGVPVKAFRCSTGLNNATPLGTFRTRNKLFTHELNGPTFGYYCSHITSNILFHSIPAPTTSRSGVPSYKFNLLGSAASEGCIRLAMGDAYWLYTTVTTGSTVFIYDDARNPGPLGKPPATTMSTATAYGFDPTDPARNSYASPK